MAQRPRSTSPSNACATLECALLACIVAGLPIRSLRFRRARRLGKARARANVTFRVGLILSGGLISLHALRFRLDGRAFRGSRSLLSPHVVDHEAAHDRAERQAVGMRAPVCSLRRFDFEHEGKKRPVGGMNQPPLVFRLA
jgi:hypothetical protein